MDPYTAYRNGMDAMIEQDLQQLRRDYRDGKLNYKGVAVEGNSTL